MGGCGREWATGVPGKGGPQTILSMETRGRQRTTQHREVHHQSSKGETLCGVTFTNWNITLRSHTFLSSFSLPYSSPLRLTTTLPLLLYLHPFISCPYHSFSLNPQSPSLSFLLCFLEDSHLPFLLSFHPSYLLLNPLLILSPALSFHYFLTVSLYYPSLLKEPSSCPPYLNSLPFFPFPPVPRSASLISSILHSHPPLYRNDLSPPSPTILIKALYLPLQP